MQINRDLRKRLEIEFGRLAAKSAQAFPPPTALSSFLEQRLPKISGIGSVHINHEVATLFGTAAVDAWLRSVHSFLISVALTDASPIWSSVSGYYSSHYSVRAIAHLLGYFQLYRRSRIVSLQLAGGKYLCNYEQKSSGDREHKFYWKAVKSDSHFILDPLFTENKGDLDTSDVGHRDRANYADHLGGCEQFRVFSKSDILNRIQFISEMIFDVPPIPQKSRYPDLESVQVIAYHRLIAFRRFLDEIIGGANRFWKVHRSPSWAGEVMDFQLPQQGSLGDLSGK